jgi:hypothetical protein
VSDNGNSNGDRWDPILASYIDEQGELLAPLRGRQMPEHPWPDTDNVMLEYLFAQAVALVEAEGVRNALIWLGTHAWKEGALADRARILRAVTT